MTDRFVADDPKKTDLDVLAVNTLRALAIDAVEKANSGHPGMPLGAAPMAHILWTRHLKFDPADPHWPDRDRFVLSAGHGSMLLYGLLNLAGFDLPIVELREFQTVGQPHAGSSRVRSDPRGGGDHRTAGCGAVQQRGHGDR